MLSALNLNENEFLEVAFNVTLFTAVCKDDETTSLLTNINTYLGSFFSGGDAPAFFCSMRIQITQFMKIGILNMVPIFWESIILYKNSTVMISIIFY